MTGTKFCLPSLVLLLVMLAVLSVRSQWNEREKFLGQEVVITVENNGIDDKSCILGNHSCQTLAYVFGQTLNGDRDGNATLDYMVTVADDQVLPIATYILPKNTTMTVQGVGETQVKLSCKDGREKIVFSSALLGVLAWENVHWFNCSSTPQNGVVLLFIAFDLLLFSQSTVSHFSGQIDVQDVRTVEISESNFTQNFYLTGPFFPVIFVIYGTFRVTNSVFVDNNSSFYTFQLLNSQNMSISIDNSTIEHNGGVFMLLRMEPVNTTQNVVIEIANSKFSSNFFQFMYDVTWDRFLGNCGIHIFINYNIISNVFFNNSIQSFFHHDEYNNAPYGIRTNFLFCKNVYVSNHGAFLTVSANKYHLILTEFAFQNNNASSDMIDLECIMCTINFTGVNVSNSFAQNAVKISTIKDAYTHGQYNMTISNSTFDNNKGTALNANADTYGQHVSSVTLEGVVMFFNNSGINGGAMYVNNVLINCNNMSSVRFENNVAHYGGALFAAFPDLDQCTQLQNNCDFTFNGNTASTSGQSVFTGVHNCSCFEHLEYDKKALSQSVSSLPSTVMPHPQDSVLTIFPGQNIAINFSFVQGCFNSSTSCVADVSLICSSVSQPFCIMDGIDIRVAGIASVLLSAGPVYTYLSVTTSKEPLGRTVKPHLKFQCQMDHSVEYSMTLNITSCPIGLYFNSSSLTCQCISLNDSNFVCSQEQGQVCVHRGYWVGSLDNQTVITACQLPFCDNNGEPCPSLQASSDFILLQALDNQCLDNRGGTLCKECSEKYTFTFEATRCIRVDLCEESWQPYALLVLAIGCQLMLAFLIILLLRMNVRGGLGYLYAPLFSIAIISNIPLAKYPYFKTIISIYSSVLLLNLEIFGYIPWCFFSTLNPLTHFAFYFLGPLVTALVVLLTVVIARLSAKRFLSVSKFPVRAICILLLLSFWSLANTSLQILGYTKIKAENETMLKVSLYPDLPYLSREHIPFWIVSVLLMVGLIIPFAFLILLAPFLSRRCDLTRVKPLLDEFQSCYRDSYRWYLAVYFFAWIFLRAMLLINEYGFLQMFMVLLAATHVVTFPYQSRWLNIMDSLLLMDLAVVSGLFQQQNSDQWQSEFLLNAMLLLPIVYVTVGFVYLVLYQVGCIGKIRNHFHLNTRKGNNVLDIDEGSIQQVHGVPVMVVGLDTDKEREPLLRYLTD